MKRNYKREYKLFHSLPLQKRKRAQRNFSRRMMLKMNKVKLHAKNGGDIHHLNKNVFDNRISNLKVIPKSKNRSMK